MLHTEGKLNKLENKKIKLWFSKYGKLLEIENRLKKKLQDLEDQIANNPRNDSAEDLQNAKDELQDRITKAHRKNERYKSEILDIIQRLEDPRYRDVLTLHFILGKSISQVATELGYTTRTIFKLYSDALSLIDISQINRDKII